MHAGKTAHRRQEYLRTRSDGILATCWACIVELFLISSLNEILLLE
jgi:hypothetical protein